MAYIGREPQLGNFQVCDAISVVNAQAAYTMQVNSVDVSPESVNHMVVSLNGVIQKPGSSYTISSATITFSRNLVTGETIDFIYLLGNVLDLGTPSDDTVTGAKIVDNAINSEHYTDASIDLAHLSADSVDGSKIVDDAINSEHYTDGSIDTAHIADNQITLAKLAGGTDGNIISYDASGDPVAIATGNDGQVLTSAGAGAPPAFEAAPGGSMTLLSTTNTSSAVANVDFVTGALDNTYKYYKLVYQNVHSVNDGVALLLNFKIGSSFISSGGAYHYANDNSTSGGSDDINSSNSANDPKLHAETLGNATGENLSGELIMWAPYDTDNYKMATYNTLLQRNDGELAVNQGGLYYDTDQAAITGLRLKFSGGNIASGRFYFYGAN